jgi:hypothetical protein
MPYLYWHWQIIIIQSCAPNGVASVALGTITIIIGSEENTCCVRLKKQEKKYMSDWQTTLTFRFLHLRWSSRLFWSNCLLLESFKSNSFFQECHGSMICTPLQKKRKVQIVWCRNPNLGLTTKARGWKAMGQEEDPGVTSHALGSAKSVRAWTLTLPSELPCWELES